jgi:hypothetical protein
MTLREAQKLDEKVFSLASYDVTMGLMPSVTSMSDVKDLQVKLFQRFNEFKGMIQRGECTFTQLEDDVVARNAAIPQDKELNFETDDLNRLTDDWEEREKEEKELKTLAETSASVLLKLLGSTNDTIDQFDSLIPPPDLYNTGESTKESDDSESNEGEEDGDTVTE